MGVFYDLGEAVIGAWQGGGWATRDPRSGRIRVWGAEFGQEGSLLYAVDAATGEIEQEHEIAAREFSAVSDPATGRLWVVNYHGLRQSGNLLQVVDPEAGSFRSVGFPPLSGNRYVGAVISQDGRRVFVGTHPGGHLCEYDTAEDQWRDLGSLAPPPLVPEQQIWLRGLVILPDGRIAGNIVRTPPHQTVVCDPGTGEWQEVPHLEGRLPSVAGDHVFLVTDAGLELLDDALQTGERIEWDQISGLEAETAGLVGAGDDGSLIVRAGDGVWRVDLSARTATRCGTLPLQGMTTLLGDTLVVADVRSQRYATLDLNTGAVQEGGWSYEGRKPTDICGLNRASDGRIYGTDIIGMHLFRFDPKKRALEDLGAVGWRGGEVYQTIEVDGKIYLGSYGGGIWGVYDPERPWDPKPESEGRDPDANPRNLGPFGDDMNRPFEYVQGPDGRIYVACRANYGYGGGGLAWYDPQTGEMGVHRDLDQSVQSVAADDQYVYGGTSIRGGRGWAETTTEARLFVFSPERQRRVYETVPVPGAIAIGSLAVSSITGLVYGSTDTAQLFAFDPRVRDVVAWWTLPEAGTPMMGVPEGYGIVHLTVGADGDIYGVTSTRVFKLDVSTDRLLFLDTSPIPDLYQIVEGEPGVFYLGARGHLLEYHARGTPHHR